MKEQKDQLVYICLPTHLVYFETTSIQRLVFAHQVLEDKTNDAILNSLKFRFELSYLGKNYQHLLLPCIPAKQHQILNQKINSEDKLNFFVKVPYKTEKIGYASGKRSAILFEKEKIIRLKGCGNLNQGFVIQNNQIRGSHYLHTAKRQFYMTKYMNQVLSNQVQMKSGNIPLYFYQYSEDLAKHQVSNYLPLIGKYCCVFETVGDRRAGTHLISPLEILYLNLCQVNSVDWKKLFLEKNRLNPDGPVEFLVDFQLNVQKGQKFIQQYKLRNIEHNYIDLLKQNITIPNSNQFHKKVELLVKKFTIGQSDQLSQLLISFNNLYDLIILVLNKVGWQMGVVKRVMCQKQINWGFFNDHGATWHCNAHLNNFIVKKPQFQAQFLYPVDYDLAFTKSQFINIELGSQTYGNNDCDVFESLLLGQYNSMEMSLSGMEIMNFKYSIEDNQNFEVDGPLKMARIAFRDTLIRSFRSGMKNQKQNYQLTNKLWNQKIIEIQKLVKACFIISSQFQT